MAKYGGNSIALKKVEHPTLLKPMYVPNDYEFFKWSPAPGGGKLVRAHKWIKLLGDQSDGKTVLEAYAGAGTLSMIYLDAGYTTIAIEQQANLVGALRKNLRCHPRGISKPNCFEADNMTILPSIASNSAKISLIDLDSYNNCIPQIKEAARILKRGYLFLSSGEIYRISRFKYYQLAEKYYGIKFRRNRRYQDFPEAVIYKFVEQEFRKHGKKTELVDTFIWPTICRLAIKVS